MDHPDYPAAKKIHLDFDSQGMALPLNLTSSHLHATEFQLPASQLQLSAGQLEQLQLPGGQVDLQETSLYPANSATYTNIEQVNGNFDLKCDGLALNTVGKCQCKEFTFLMTMNAGTQCRCPC